MGLSQVLSSAVSGLSVAQAGLSLVADNVANANTPGYVRKTLLQTANAAGDGSAGVQVSGINRELDQFVQTQYRTETSGASYADLRSQIYQQLQQVYGDPSSSSSLAGVYNSFTTALQALTTSPDDSSAQSTVLTSAQALTQQLNSMTSQVQGLRSQSEQGLSTAVTSANNAMQQIAAINQQLAASTRNDAATASLLDQRDQYIDQLSQLMDIRVQQGDANQISIFTGSGIQLVGSQASTLSFNAQGSLSPTAQYSTDPTKDEVGTVTLTSPTGGSIDLIANNAIKSGQIAAYIDMRDNVLPQAQLQLDQIAASMASAMSNQTTDGTPVSSGSLSGYKVDVSGLSAGNTINVTYTDNATNTQKTLTIVRVDDPSALPLSNSATTDPNDTVIGVDFSGGLASVVSQLNNQLNGRIQFSNPSGTQIQVLNSGTSAVNDVSTTQTATSLSSGSSPFPFFTDGGFPYTGAITSSGSQSVGLAGRITVNADLLADPSKLVAYSASTASGDATRPNFIYNQLTTASLNFSPTAGIGTVASPFSGSLPSYVQQMLSTQAGAASAASSLSQGQDVLLNSLKSRMDDTSGVNIDQEMANLLTLQNSYSANARVLSTVQQMMQLLLQM